MKEKIDSFFQHNWLPLALVMAIATFFSFFKLGVTPLHQWDEALHGELALEMLRTGDLLNFYFGGQPDAWFAKPPLAIWSIALSFKVFGANEWALRLPSALFILGAFYYLFKLIRLYRDNYFAFFTVLMLVSINGLICRHVGRTGDTDAPLVMFLIAASYHFLLFVDFYKSRSGIWVGIFLTLAFLAKSAAFAVLLPGWFFYLFYKRQLKTILLKWQTWLALLILLITIAGWVIAIDKYGNQFEDKPYEGTNAVETTIKYDLIERFTENGMDTWLNESTFFITVMDSRFTLWNYWIYLLVLVAIFQKQLRNIYRSDYKTNIHLFSLFSWVPLSIFLTLVAGKHYWYMAPVFPFIAINAWELIRFYSAKYKLALFITAGLFITTISIKFNYFNTPGEYPELLSKNTNAVEKANRVVSSSNTPLHYFLYLHFHNPNSIVKALNKYQPEPGDLLVIENSEMQQWEALKTPHTILDANEFKTLILVE